LQQSEYDGDVDADAEEAALYTIVRHLRDNGGDMMVHALFGASLGTILTASYSRFDDTHPDFDAPEALPNPVDSGVAAVEELERLLTDVNAQVEALAFAWTKTQSQENSKRDGGGGGASSSSANDNASPRPGRRLVIVGLSARPEYNGCRGVVVGPAVSAGRWVVAILDLNFRGEQARVSLPLVAFCVLAF
jgi:hypothetical protein